MKESLQYQRSYELCEVIHNVTRTMMHGIKLWDFLIMHPFIIPYNYIFIKTWFPCIPKTFIWKCNDTTNNQLKCNVIQVRQTLSINIVSHILLGDNLSLNTPFCISFAFFYSNFILHSLVFKHDTYLQQCNNYSNKRSFKKMLQ
jgi:hypothetical protein